MSGPRYITTSECDVIMTSQDAKIGAIITKSLWHHMTKSSHDIITWSDRWAELEGIVKACKGQKSSSAADLGGSEKPIWVEKAFNGCGVDQDKQLKRK